MLSKKKKKKKELILIPVNHNDLKIGGLQIQLRRLGGLKRLRTTVLQHPHIVFPEHEIIQRNRNSSIP